CLAQLRTPHWSIWWSLNLYSCTWYTFFFFFQAEDGIRDFHVTGVQTCALPISARCEWKAFPAACLDCRPREDAGNGGRSWWPKPRRVRLKELPIPLALSSVRVLAFAPDHTRSVPACAERRVP